MISCVPFPNCRSGVIGLAIAGNPENDGHLSPWQEAARHERLTQDDIGIFHRVISMR
jgi:hypothetical protein